MDRMTAPEVATAPAAGERSPVRTLIAGSTGAGMANFDWTIMGYLVATMSPLFFPASAHTALLATLTAFAVGFFACPIGGIALGFIGDRLGRRAELVVIIILTSAATVLIGALPTYAQVGVLAPILLFLARVAQGFAVGGDFGSSGAFMVEHAPPNKRGMYGSWQQVGLPAGALLASGVVALWTNSVSEEQLSAWGWRIPFFIAIVPALFAIYIRFRTHETPTFAALKEEGEIAKVPLWESIRDHWRQVLIVAAIYGYWVMLGVTLTAYSVTYATTETPLKLSQALTANVIALVTMIAMIPLAGALSDRVGRKPLLLTSCAAVVVLAFPIYLLMAAGTFWSFLAGSLLMAMAYAAFGGPAPAALAEMFPGKVRVSGVTLGSTIATALAGGLTPLGSAWLIDVTGTRLGAAWLLTALSVLGLGTIVFAVKETAKSPLAD